MLWSVVFFVCFINILFTCKCCSQLCSQNEMICSAVKVFPTDSLQRESFETMIYCFTEMVYFKNELTTYSFSFCPTPFTLIYKKNGVN